MNLQVVTCQIRHRVNFDKFAESFLPGHIQKTTYKYIVSLRQLRYHALLDILAWREVGSKKDGDSS